MRSATKDSVCLSLVSEARIEEQSPGQFILTGARIEFPLAGSTGAVVELIRRIEAGPASEQELLRAAAAAGPEVATDLSFCLLLLGAEGLLCRTVMAADAPLLTSMPRAAADDAERPPFSSRASHVLSRFAYCRREGNRFVLESPLSTSGVVLHDSRATALLAALARPCRASDLRTAVPGLSMAAAKLAAELLWEAGMLAVAEPAGASSGREPAALTHWEFHDLLFHARSRQGRHSAGYGQTNRLFAETAPLSALKPAMSADFIDLPRPDITRLEAVDLTLTGALEHRHSERRHGERPITLGQLAEFLYRSVRVRTMGTRDDEEYTDRVYPGAGSSYELEFYLVAHRCVGLDPGLYHYQPREHRLYRLAAKPEETGSFLESAARTAGSAWPQVLIVFAARFARIMRRYESIGYALILKDVGAVFQTMYLVATAMKLAACALGGGDSDLFARAAATDYYAETSVGEFMLGSAPGP